MPLRGGCFTEGGIDGVSDHLPAGGGNGPNAEQLAEGEKKLKRYKKYVEAMTEEVCASTLVSRSGARSM